MEEKATMFYLGLLEGARAVVQWSALGLAFVTQVRSLASQAPPGMTPRTEEKKKVSFMLKDYKFCK